MVTTLCGAGCGTSGQPMATYTDYCDEVTLRRYGNPYFVLIGCNVNIADITDLVAVAALVTSGDIVVGPVGKFDVPKPSVVTSEDINICSGVTVINTTYAPTFSTYQTADNDCEYWADLLKRHKSFRVMWFDCDQNLSAQGEYIDFLRDPANASVPTGNPGFEFTVAEPPHPVEGDGKKVRWEVVFNIELSGSEIIRYANLPGLFDAMLPA